MKTNKLLLTRGAPASGKSTFAREWVNEDPAWRIRSNRDDLRQSLYGKDVLDRMGEETVSLVQKAQVKTALMADLNVIVDDTNLAARFVKEWLKLAREVGVTVEFIDFDTPLEACLAYNQRRAADGGRFVPEDVIVSFFQRYYNKGQLPPVPVLEDAVDGFKLYEPDDSLPKAYLVDIDGTLARMNGRGPFDWARVGEDSPIENVIRVVQALEKSLYKIIFMSGRDAASRTATIEWLKDNVTYTDDELELYMRPERDMRKDSIVKHELFYKYVASKYHVVGVIDDRQQVVDMWRQIGLTVFQCARGDF